MLLLSSNRKRVLTDHKQVGKRFIPPFIHAFGAYKSTTFFDPGWYDRIIPELLYHGLLNDMFGLKRGADLSLALAKQSVSAISERERILFIGTSDFKKLTNAEKTAVKLGLKVSGDLEDIKYALYPLFRFYKEFPLDFLYSDGAPIFDNSSEILSGLESFVAKASNRWGTEGTLLQANAVYIAFATNFLFVKKGLTLANFPEIQNFPHTDESKRVGAAVRCTVSLFFGIPERAADMTWSNYFWNRGKELEKCKLCQKIRTFRLMKSKKL